LLQHQTSPPSGSPPVYHLIAGVVLPFINLFSSLYSNDGSPVLVKHSKPQPLHSFLTISQHHQRGVMVLLPSKTSSIFRLLRYVIVYLKLFKVLTAEECLKII